MSDSPAFDKRDIIWASTVARYLVQRYTRIEQGARVWTNYKVRDVYYSICDTWKIQRQA